MVRNGQLKKGEPYGPQRTQRTFLQSDIHVCLCVLAAAGKDSGQHKRGKNTDLKGAQSTIEMPLMLRDKTQGNLTGTEEKLLNDTIATLQSNYAEETAKDSASPG